MYFVGNLTEDCMQYDLSFVAIDKCLTRTLDMSAKLSENVYEVVYESRLMTYGAGVWGLKKGWKEIYIIQGRFCKKV
jgi:hypothetical protein